MNLTPRELCERLKGDVERLCRELLPNGKRAGHEWEVGSLSGEPGKSLKVHLSGEKAGVWSDFATGQSGDVLDLWCAVRGIDLGQAIREAKAYLGIHEPHWHGHKPKTHRRPQRPPKARRPQADSPVMAYLKGRGLTEATIAAFKVAEEAGAVHFPHLPDNPGTIVFPSLREGELIAVKYLALKRIETEGGTGKKQITQESDCEPCLFGWQALSPTTRAVCLCEGQIDAMTLHQFGIQALSVPDGAGNHQWVEHEYERLERFDTLFLCFDQDEAGLKGVEELLERLGRHRCRVVELAHKDANECLKHGWTIKQFADAFMGARYVDPLGLKNAACYVDEVIAEFYPPPDAPVGTSTPWGKVGTQLLFRKAEVTLWSGFNGHGKTNVLGFTMAHAMAYGERVCMASMEMPARRLLYRLTKQLGGVGEPSIPYIREVHRWLEDKLWLFDEVGTVKAERLLEVFRYARRRYRVSHFVLDSLAKCGLAEDDYNAQKAIVEALCDLAHEFDVHVHVVAHARKGADEKTKPGKMDVKGTGALTDMVDTVVAVWRNKVKEEGIEQARADGEPPGEEWLAKPDAVLNVCKQRNGAWEGSIALWFHAATLQYLGGPAHKPVQYVPFSIHSQDEASR